MKIYSVTVDEDLGEDDSQTTYFATKERARSFVRKHVDSGIECGAVITYEFKTRAALVHWLNDLLSPTVTDV